MKRALECVTSHRFAPFGKILEFTPDMEEKFHIIMSEEKEPWRIAVFRYDNRNIHTIERHPTTMESFEPLSGITVLLVAEYETPDEPVAFLLDKPVCLYKGIWHQVLSLTESAQVKITENLEVPGTEFHRLQNPVRIYAADEE